MDGAILERRRPELITAAWWKEERGTRVLVDFNQNAPHRTVFGTWSVRARPGAQVSTPFSWAELDTIEPDASAAHARHAGGAVAGPGRLPCFADRRRHDAQHRLAPSGGRSRRIAS
jgi:LigD, primase-polymerase domain